METKYMPRVTFKETITKEIEISIETLYKLIDHLNEEEKAKLLERLTSSPLTLAPFKKDKIESIIADFKAVDLYEDNFLKDLEESLKKSSAYTWAIVPIIVPLRKDLEEYLPEHSLQKKWVKAKKLFEDNPSHPSFNTELLEPKHHFIYSFRMDKNLEPCSFACLTTR